MAHTTWQILPAPDRIIVEKFAGFSDHFKDGSYSFTIFTSSNSAQPLRGTLASLKEGNPFGSTEIGDLGLIRNAALNFSFPDGNSGSFVIGRGAGVDDVTLNIPDHIPQQDSLGLVADFRRAFAAYERTVALDKALGAELADFYRIREESLLRLEEANLRLVEQSTSYRRSLDEESQRVASELREEYQSKRDKLDAEMNLRESGIAERESQLSSQLKLLDDRRATHARRQLRKDLLDKLTARSGGFTLSQATERKRIPVHGAFIALLGMAGYAIYLTAHSTTVDTSWVVGVRLLTSVVAFAASALFYIRWNDAWASRHAREEFQMRRMELDVDRASWVVEMLLEWKDEREGSPIPAELLEALVAGLFRNEDAGSQNRVRHPAEDLATALLGASSNLELNVAGNKLTLDRKGLRKLENAHDG